jgi:type I restriction enzyme S subunit
MGRDMSTSQDFVNWVCGARITPTYLMLALLSARHRLRALSSGSTHRTIYMRVVEKFKVLVPPIRLQQEFTENINDLTSHKLTNTKSLSEMDSLFASLQHRAFRGEL